MNLLRLVTLLTGIAIFVSVGTAKPPHRRQPTTAPAGVRCLAFGNCPGVCGPVCPLNIWVCPSNFTCPLTAPATQPAATLDRATADALIEVLKDEQRAEALYAAIMAKYGELRPFSNIIRAERRHQEALTVLADRYGVALPETAVNSVAREIPETLQACITAAIQAEKDNVALYDRLLPAITQADVRSVMTQLRDASAERHLPALQRAAGRY